MDARPNILNYQHIADYLKAVLQSRALKRPHYSVKVWARIIGMESPSLLNAVLRKERRLSEKLAECLKAHLELSEQETKYFNALTVFSGPRAPLEDSVAIDYLNYLSHQLQLFTPLPRISDSSKPYEKELCVGY